MEQRLAAAAQRHQLRLVQSIPLDGRLISRPIEGTMALRHGPEETVEKIEADAEILSMKPLLFTLR